MHLGVIHTIRDRAAWDAAVGSGADALPPEAVLLGSVTQADVSRAICIWDAPSLEYLQRMLDDMLGDAAVNDCFVADPARSLALPTPGAATPA